MSNETIKHPDPNIYWKHRRRLCYIAFIWSIIMTIMLGGLAFINPEAVSAMGAVIGWAYGLCTAIVMGYYGNSAIEEYAKKKFK